MLASPFGTIHAATFSFPQPVGTLIPDPPSYQLASVGTYDPESTGSLGRDLSGTPPQSRPRLDFPTVNRRLKGDLLVMRPQDDQTPAGTRDLTPGRVKTVSFPNPAAGAAEPDVDTDARESKSESRLESKSESKPSTYAVASLTPPQRATPAETPPGETEESNAAVRLGRLYFGNLLGGAVGTIEPWPAEQELVIEAPAHDPDIKRSALAPPQAGDFNFGTSSAAPMPGEAALPGPAPSAGETLAPKGEVTGAGRRPRTPAERLGLDTRSRAKSEKCLAEAVYFESRGEVKRGQIAVAQVVMNRVFSGYYPTNVCGVVYQNAHRKLACQFTFACDGIPDVVEEPDMWAQAKDIARDMLDGKLWLPEIGHSTHYHAYWVHPSWVNEMRKIHKIGVHSFYRPRAWGNTVEVPNHPFVAPQAKM
jgi:hypothetical protein